MTEPSKGAAYPMSEHEKPPTRDEIRQRRRAIADSAAHYRAEFNRGQITVKTCLEYLQAECEHPPEAITKEYAGRNFVAKCGDCGKVMK
jgi:hypothetical protein